MLVPIVLFTLAYLASRKASDGSAKERMGCGDSRQSGDDGRCEPCRGGSADHRTERLNAAPAPAPEMSAVPATEPATVEAQPTAPDSVPDSSPENSAQKAA